MVAAVPAARWKNDDPQSLGKHFSWPPYWPMFSSSFSLIFSLSNILALAFANFPSRKLCSKTMQPKSAAVAK